MILNAAGKGVSTDSTEIRTQWFTKISELFKAYCSYLSSHVLSRLSS